MPEGGRRSSARRARLDRAALASNWRQVLAVDAAIGLAVVLAGLVVVVAVSAAIGVVMAVAGAVYVGLGLLRWRRWARLRAEAGLAPPTDPSDT